MPTDSLISNLKEPWLQLPPKTGKGGATESPKSYAKFERFRGLPPEERTLARLAELLGTTLKSLEKLAARYEWIERAAAWDRRQAQARAEAAAEEQQRRAKEDIELWSKRKRELCERKFQMGQALIDKGEARLKLPNTERVMSRKDGSSVVLQPRSTRDAVEMIRTGFDLQQQAIDDGLATSSALEEINEFQIDDYAIDENDSPTPDSPSGFPKPAEIPSLRRAEERLFGPRGHGQDGGPLLSGSAVGGAQPALRGTDRRPHIHHDPRRHSHNHASDPGRKAHSIRVSQKRIRHHASQSSHSVPIPGELRAPARAESGLGRHRRTDLLPGGSLASPGGARPRPARQGTSDVRRLDAEGLRLGLSAVHLRREAERS